MARRSSYYIECDFCNARSHSYASKDILDRRVFGEDAIYPWKVTSKGKHACTSCYPTLKESVK